MPTPRIMRNQVAKDLHNDLQEVIEVADSGTTRKTISIFEIAAFLDVLSSKTNLPWTNLHLINLHLINKKVRFRVRYLKGRAT